MELNVQIVKILPVQTFAKKDGSNGVRNTFVGRTMDSQYPKEVCFQVIGEERWSQMGIREGGSYVISFDIESRAWKEQYITNCNAWKSVCLDGGSQGGSYAQPQGQQYVPQQQMPQQPYAPQQPQPQYAAPQTAPNVQYGNQGTNANLPF